MDEKKVYLVLRGRVPGIYNSWEECEKQIRGIIGAGYEVFPVSKYGNLKETRKEAAKYKHKMRSIVSARASHWNSNTSKQPLDQQLKLYYGIDSNVITGVFNSELILKIAMRQSTYSRYKRFARESEAAEFVAKMKQERIIRILQQYPIERELNSIDVRGLPKKVIGAFEFRVDEYDRVQCVVDGTCFYDSQGNAKAHVRVLFDEHHPLNIDKQEGLERATKNAGELLSIVQALDIANRFGILRIKLYSDAEFVLRSLKYWSKKWESNGWRSSRGKLIESKELFQKILNKKREREIDVNWVHLPTKALMETLEGVSY